ncbi:4-aminobutyrate--2-oxoglutarate transaminase [Labrys wisconsinensis]|uniref:4-aminobutyrate aminotransferase/(S)-3-amino-2-methylpropionate transaminase n=1 Tax=Labrys wisconsinensis TaxID=425677 RepID=A0ABU0JBX4_9HYPH|nr:4-aminobutyrate--2-oxoglutarate transaminase [Labrys wisconsinensis]MDQ0471075.1 4-aminobutyrate aminotransferase/(S)-3-amino-2-methylpropionate transaminase [Labrys wisconsinensis]
MNAPAKKIPGANRTQTDELLERRANAFSRGMSAGQPVFASKAKNSEIWDVEGRRFIDFGGGIAVLNTGHRHPKVMKRVYDQLERFTHTCLMVTPYEPAVLLAEKLNEIAPISGDKKTMLVTTGAEAVENAIKIARAATGRSDVVVFSGAFHGRTLLAMAMTGKVVPYKTKFGPFPGGVWRVPYPIEHKGFSIDDTFEAFKWLFKTDVDPKTVAAIVIEPVQGEGGFYVAPPELLKRLRALCDEHGILLIADEIQTGFGRTGKWFAMEHSGVEPDLITTAKSLAGGFPLAGVVGRAAIMDAPEPGGLGGTYAGNPVACAAALGVIEAFESENLLEKSLKQGETIIRRLKAIKRRKTGRAIGDIRGLGGMTAFELVTRHGGNEPDPAAAKALAADCLERGLMILTCGVFGETVRLLAPLTIQPKVLKEGLDILEAALVA